VFIVAVAPVFFSLRSGSDAHEVVDDELASFIRVSDM